MKLVSTFLLALLLGGANAIAETHTIIPDRGIVKLTADGVRDIFVHWVRGILRARVFLKYYRL